MLRYLDLCQMTRCRKPGNLSLGLNDMVGKLTRAAEVAKSAMLKTPALSDMPMQ